MSSSTADTTREAEALAEIGRTCVRPVGAHLLTGAFLLLLLSGAALELAAARTGQENLLRGEGRLVAPSFRELGNLWRARGTLAVAGELREAGVAAEDRIQRDSRLAAAVRHPLQGLLSRYLRYGNSQVLLGEEQWLFFRDDFDHLTGAPFLAPSVVARGSGSAPRHPSQAPSPLPAILGLAADLQARGLGFVLVPVPTKLGIAWERFLGGRERGGPALANPSQAALLEGLRTAGVEVFDPTPLLREMEIRGENPYMRFDSHWSPAGIDRTAAALATFLRDRFELDEALSLEREDLAFERRADLGDLLGLDPERNPYLLEPLRIQAVHRPGGRPYSSRSGHGQVLLVGDSFSRLLIRNKRNGGDANFAAELAFHLQAPVAMRAENDAGDSFARRVGWLRQPHQLDGRRVVVLEVAERSFSLGDWTSERLTTAQ